MLEKFQDLEIIERLDETHGGTTQIHLGKYRNKLLVCKSISKSTLQDHKSIEHVMNQKQALKFFTQRGSKGINKIVHTFQDTNNLYIVVEPIEGLPLHKIIQMVGNLNADFTRVIVSQVGLILKQFHQNGFIYRDVKASNFMIDQRGKVTMIDLGHTKKIGKDRTYTICGTTHSMPPQIYLNEGYSYEFDYYGFGILIFQLLTGKAPFGYGNSNPNIIQDMKKGIGVDKLEQIECPITRDLIKRLLSDSTTRLGCKNGFSQILEHDYFNVPQFLDAKDIYEETADIDAKDPRYQLYISQIVDFGIDELKYKKIEPQDPFYKFYQ